MLAEQSISGKLLITNPQMAAADPDAAYAMAGAGGCSLVLLAVEKMSKECSLNGLLLRVQIFEHEDLLS